MTAVGKILVVLHLVLSIMFMAFAGAVFTSNLNWRMEAEKKAKELTSERGKLSNQQAAFDTERKELNAKIADQATQITGLTGEKTNLQTQATALADDNKRLNVALDAQRDLAALNGVEADERTKEANLQRSKNSVLYQSREELVASLQKANDDKFALDLKLQNLVEKHDSILTDYATMKRFLASKNLTTDPKQMMAQVTPPPPLEGVVVDYKKEKGGMEYVEVSLGLDENLSAGNIMTLYSSQGNKYLGQIRLTSVYAKKSVGVVLKDQKAKNATIQKGDNVSTKL